jgi:pimeloyl-ACP methyl ester carboxylesterase
LPCESWESEYSTELNWRCSIRSGELWQQTSQNPRPSVGLPRLLASRSVPPEVRPEFCAVFCRRQFLAAVRAEAAAQKENSAEVRVLASLGKMPLVVVSHDPDKVRFPGNLSEPVNSEWGKMQEELAHLSRNGSHLVVAGSGHDIQIDKPEAVVDAIRKVLGQAKGAG